MEKRIYFWHEPGNIIQDVLIMAEACRYGESWLVTMKDCVADDLRGWDEHTEETWKVFDAPTLAEAMRKAKQDVVERHPAASPHGLFIDVDYPAHDENLTF